MDSPEFTRLYMKHVVRRTNMRTFHNLVGDHAMEICARMMQDGTVLRRSEIHRFLIL